MVKWSMTCHGEGEDNLVAAEVEEDIPAATVATFWLGYDKE